MAEEVILAKGGLSSLRHLSGGGWTVEFTLGGAAKTIAFTDSVDMIDWLSTVCFRSDGGKTKQNWEANNGGGPSTTPAAQG